MRIQVIFAEIFVGILLSGLAWGNCFDFSQKIDHPLKQTIGLSADRDNSVQGKTEKDIVWAEIRGVVKKPIGNVLKILLDHNSTRSPRVKEMTVTQEPKGPYLAHHKVKFEINPFPFVWIKWIEEWGYALAGGKEEDPQSIVISYQKIEGTSHIEHLCGSMVLRKLDPSSTDVFQYEEAKATQRSAEDTLKGLDGTLKTLRK